MAMSPHSERVAARRGSIVTWAALVALILTLVAACGGGSSEPACQTASDAAPSSPSPETSLTIKIGSYHGKGSPQCIKEIGFQPVMVVIKGDTGKFTVWRSSSMKG